jgi:hypothetical protein
VLTPCLRPLPELRRRRAGSSAGGTVDHKVGASFCSRSCQEADFHYEAEKVLQHDGESVIVKYPEHVLPVIGAIRY